MILSTAVIYLKEKNMTKGEKEKMSSGDYYSAVDEELVRERDYARNLTYEFNHTRPTEKERRLEIIVLSLLPGILILAFYSLVSWYAVPFSIPSILVIFAAIAIILVPFELGFLIYQGRKVNKRISLNNVVLFREKVPVIQFIIFVVILIKWSEFVFRCLSTRIDTLFVNNFFYWVPKWFFLDSFYQHISQYSKTVLLVTWILGLIFNGIIGPIVEELYFRGYLLPRMKHMKGWAPIINVLLFSLYHFFTPWQNVTRIIALLPLVYVVWWKRNIYIGIVTHCALNITGMIGMLPIVLK
jgi:membrane protease YdiL (CAAX protease family)